MYGWVHPQQKYPLNRPQKFITKDIIIGVIIANITIGITADTTKKSQST
jgi:hypothetical protein